MRKISPVIGPAIVIGGIGGILPSLVKLGTFYAANPQGSLPELGVLIAFAIFFAIGGVVAAAVSTPGYQFKDFLIAGICAPAMVTNLVAGYSDGSEQRSGTVPTESSASLFIPSIISVASAGVKEIPSTTAVADRTLTVYIRAPGVPLKDLQTIAISLNVGGRTIPIPGQFRTKGVRMLTVGVSAETDQVEFSGGSAKTVLMVPKSDQALIAELEIKVEGTRDLLWVFGAKRQPRISEMRANLREVGPARSDRELVGVWTITRWQLPAGSSPYTPRRQEGEFSGDLIVKPDATGALVGLATFYLDQETRVTENFTVTLDGDEIRMNGTVTERGDIWNADRFVFRLDDGVLIGRVSDNQPGLSRVTYERIIAPQIGP